MKTYPTPPNALHIAISVRGSAVEVDDFGTTLYMDFLNSREYGSREAEWDIPEHALAFMASGKEYDPRMTREEWLKIWRAYRHYCHYDSNSQSDPEYMDVDDFKYAHFKTPKA